MKHRNIVIGSSLSAVLFAYLNKYTILLPSHRGPFKFDRLPEDVDINQISVPTRKKRPIWSSLLFELGLEGLSPYGTDVNFIRIAGDEITISIRETSVIKNKFDNCFIFDSDSVQTEAEIIEAPPERFRVLDWINVRSGAVHDRINIETADDFVSQVHFYKSKRIDGKHNKKDLVAVSYLTKEQILDFDYSDTMVKFKVESLMRKYGIKGAKSGVNPGDKPKRYSVKIEPSYREVLKVSKTKYKDLDNVKFLDLTEKEIIEKYAGVWT